MRWVADHAVQRRTVSDFYGALRPQTSGFLDVRSKSERTQRCAQAQQPHRSPRGKENTSQLQIAIQVCSASSLLCLFKRTIKPVVLFWTARPSGSGALPCPQPPDFNLKMLPSFDCHTLERCSIMLLHTHTACSLCSLYTCTIATAHTHAHEKTESTDTLHRQNVFISIQTPWLPCHSRPAALMQSRSLRRNRVSTWQDLFSKCRFLQSNVFVWSCVC